MLRFMRKRNPIVIPFHPVQIGKAAEDEQAAKDFLVPDTRESDGESCGQEYRWEHTQPEWKLQDAGRMSEQLPWLMRHGQNEDAGRKQDEHPERLRQAAAVIRIKGKDADEHEEHRAPHVEIQRPQRSDSTNDVIVPPPFIT